MITHYLKIAFRNLLKYKMQTAISVVGLAVGFTCFALSAIWIHYEMTYDHFHEDAGQLHIVRMKDNGTFARNGLSFATPYPFAQYLKDNFAEVKSACPIQGGYGSSDYTAEGRTHKMQELRLDSAAFTVTPPTISVGFTMGGSISTVIPASEQSASSHFIALQSNSILPCASI